MPRENEEVGIEEIYFHIRSLSLTLSLRFIIN